jgi:hypothetical protein
LKLAQEKCSEDLISTNTGVKWQASITPNYTGKKNRRIVVLGCLGIKLDPISKITNEKAWWRGSSNRVPAY